jgi:hypothetical protein
METLKSVNPRITANRPLEYVCLFPMEYASGAFIFMAMDGYSDFSIHLGTENNDSSKTMLKSLRTLMEHVDFVSHQKNDFTIVLPKYEDSARQINEIIHPFGGKLAFNSSFVRSVRVPFAKKLYADIAESN